MPRSKAVQYRFTKGELDPELNGRSDIDLYYSTAATLTNVFVLPQGSVTRRPGLLYLDELRNTITEYAKGSITPTDPGTNGGTPANLLDDDLATYMLNTTGISTTDDYVSWRLDLGSLQDVAFIDVQKVSISALTTTEFEVEKSDDAITWTPLSSPLSTPHTITLDQTERYYRLAVDDNIRYLRLVRNGTTDLTTSVVKTAEVEVWLDSGSLGESRLNRFEFNDEQDYAMLFTDENIAIYKDGVLQANVASPYTSAQVADINFTQSNDIAIYVHKDVAPYQLSRRGGHNLWDFLSITFDTVPKFDYDGTTSNPAVALTLDSVEDRVKVTDAATGSTFSGAALGYYIDGHGGRGRIIELIDANNVWVQAEKPFISSGASVIASGAWDYETSWEDLWSSNRGYPRATTFYKGRLILGGFRSLPSTLAASWIDDIYNYDYGSSLNDEAFDITMDSNEPNVIYHLISHDNLEIFTSSSEVVIKTDENLTPTGKAKFSRQSSQGSKLGITPTELEDGGTLFVQKGGRSLLEFIFSDETLSYGSSRISLISSHLMNDPVDATVRGNTSTEEANYYLQVNSDGELIVATILKAQEIIAFTRNTTEGNFKNIVSVNESLYAVVERTINGTVKRYFEEVTFDRLTDSCKYILAGDSTISGTAYATASITPTAPQGGTAASVNDSDLTTFLLTTGNVSTTDDYIAFSLDLGSNQAVDYIDLQLLSITLGSTTEFQIEYSTDNFSSDINVCGETISLTTTATDFEMPIGATTRYIRLIRNGTTDLSTAKISIAEATVHLDKTITVSGFDYLEDKTVWPIIDGVTYNQVTVASGSITIPVNVLTDLEVGLDFDTLIVTNPIEDPQATGPLMGNLKSISEIIVNVHNTKHLLVNGYTPFKETLSTSSSSSTIDNAPTSFTGRYRMVGFRGWDQSGQITISQTYPQSMTLLNLALYFNFGK